MRTRELPEKKMSRENMNVGYKEKESGSLRGRFKDQRRLPLWYL